MHFRHNGARGFAIAVSAVLAACSARGKITLDGEDVGASGMGASSAAAGRSGSAGQTSQLAGSSGAGRAAAEGGAGSAAYSGAAGDTSQAAAGMPAPQPAGATRLIGVGSFGLRGRSDDGALWAYCGNPSQGDEHSPDLLRAVGYGNGVFIAVGGDQNGRVMRSLDGEFWDEDVHPLDACAGEGYPSSCSNWMGAVAYHDGVWLAGGGNGANMRSKDAGRSWQGLHHGFPEKHIRSLGAGAGRFIAGTDGGGLYVTADHGDSWQAKSVWSGAAASAILQIAYGNNSFVAFSEEGDACFVSGDLGESWQPCAAAAEGGTSYLFDGQQWVAALSKAYATSPDALSWTRHAVTNMPRQLLFDGSNYFGRSEGALYRSESLDTLQRVAMNVADFRAWTLGRVLSENLPMVGVSPTACVDNR